MDAIMAALAATLLANADGRYARLLAALVDGRRQRRQTVLIFFAAYAALALPAAAGAVAAGRAFGPGVLNLTAAIALASAGLALLWTGRRPIDPAPLVAASRPGLFVWLLLHQLGDRNQFLVFALGALSGAPPWAVIGGGAGLLVAMLPVQGWGVALLDHRHAKRLRWAAALLLLLWAGAKARAAFGV